jgi:lipoprotein-releasing system permease protein
LNFPFYVAKRYFFTNPEKNKLLFGVGFTRVLSLVSMLIVSIATALLIIILSAFNGLEGLTRGLFGQHNAEIKVSPKLGKTFIYTDSLKKQVESVNTISAITEVLEDNALLRYADAQMVVNAKGVSENFLAQYPLDTAIVSGNAEIKRNGINYALVGFGVQYQLNINLSAVSRALQFWYPKNSKNVQLNPAKAFRKKSILPAGVFSIEQQTDMTSVIVPIEFMQGLLDYDKERTYLEIKTKEDESISETQDLLKQALGTQFDVKNAEEQQESVLKAIQIERLFIFIAFIFVLIIASFNTFATLVILVIEKRKDIAVMLAMGTSRSDILKIFLFEGAIIGAIGTFIGLFFGFVITALQIKYGFVSIGVETAVVQAFPLALDWQDFIATGFAMLLITAFASFVPARNASKVEIDKYL